MSQYRLVSISQQTSRIPVESEDALGAVVASLACAPVDAGAIPTQWSFVPIGYSMLVMILVFWQVSSVRRKL